MDNWEKEIKKAIIDKLDRYRNENVSDHWKTFSELLGSEKPKPFFTLRKLAFLLPMMLILSGIISFYVIRTTERRNPDKNSGMDKSGKEAIRQSDKDNFNNANPGQNTFRGQKFPGLRSENILAPVSDSSITHLKQEVHFMNKHHVRKMLPVSGIRNVVETATKKDDPFKPLRTGAYLDLITQLVMLPSEDSLFGSLKPFRISDTLIESLKGKPGKQPDNVAGGNHLPEAGLFAGFACSGIFSNTTNGLGLNYRAGIYFDEMIGAKFGILAEPNISLSTGNKLEKHSDQVRSFLYPEYDYESVTCRGILKFNLPVSLKIPIVKNNCLTAGFYGNWFMNSLSTVIRQTDNGRTQLSTTKYNVTGYTDGFNAFNYGCSAGYQLAIPGRFRLRISYTQDLSTLINAGYFPGVTHPLQSGLGIELEYKILGK
jgi:hypothetical protein